MAFVKGYHVEVRALSAVDGGGWLATVPDLPGCVSDGQSAEEALQNVADAIDQWLQTAADRGREMPPASTPTSLRKRLNA